MARSRDGKERTARVPETTVLKLFVYPGKDGRISSYTTTYCVGFEMSNVRTESHKEAEERHRMGIGGPEPETGTYVSQHFITPWVESYEDVTRSYEAWRDRLRCEEVVGRKRRKVA